MVAEIILLVDNDSKKIQVQVKNDKSEVNTLSAKPFLVGLQCLLELDATFKLSDIHIQTFYEQWDAGVLTISTRFEESEQLLALVDKIKGYFQEARKTKLDINVVELQGLIDNTSSMIDLTVESAAESAAAEMPCDKTPDIDPYVLPTQLRQSNSRSRILPAWDHYFNKFCSLIVDVSKKLRDNGGRERRILKEFSEQYKLLQKTQYLIVGKKYFLNTIPIMIEVPNFIEKMGHQLNTEEIKHKGLKSGIEVDVVTFSSIILGLFNEDQLNQRSIEVLSALIFFLTKDDRKRIGVLFKIINESVPSWSSEGKEAVILNLIQIDVSYFNEFMELKNTPMRKSEHFGAFFDAVEPSQLAFMVRAVDVNSLVIGMLSPSNQKKILKEAWIPPWVLFKLTMILGHKEYCLNDVAIISDFPTQYMYYLSSDRQVNFTLNAHGALWVLLLRQDSDIGKQDIRKGTYVEMNTLNGGRDDLQVVMRETGIDLDQKEVLLKYLLVDPYYFKLYMSTLITGSRESGWADPQDQERWEWHIERALETHGPTIISNIFDTLQPIDTGEVGAGAVTLRWQMSSSFFKKLCYACFSTYSNTVDFEEVFGLMKKDAMCQMPYDNKLRIGYLNSRKQEVELLWNNMQCYSLFMLYRGVGAFQAIGRCGKNLVADFLGIRNMNARASIDGAVELYYMKQQMKNDVTKSIQGYQLPCDGIFNLGGFEEPNIRVSLTIDQEAYTLLKKKKLFDGMNRADKCHEKDDSLVIVTITVPVERCELDRFHADRQSVREDLGCLFARSTSSTVSMHGSPRLLTAVKEVKAVSEEEPEISMSCEGSGVAAVAGLSAP